MKLIASLFLLALLAGCGAPPVTVYSDDNVVFSGTVTSQSEGVVHLSVDGDGTTCNGQMNLPDGPGIVDGDFRCDDGRKGSFVATVSDAYSVAVGRLDGTAAFAMLIDLKK